MLYSGSRFVASAEVPLKGSPSCQGLAAPFQDKFMADDAHGNNQAYKDALHRSKTGMLLAYTSSASYLVKIVIMSGDFV